MLFLKAKKDAHSWDLCALAFSPDGQTLLSAALGGCVRLWDLRTGTHRLLPDSPYPRGVTFSPNGQTLACLHTHGFTIWELSATDLQVRTQLAGHPAFLCYSPDGNRLFTYGYRQGVQVWNTATWERSTLCNPSHTPPTRVNIDRLAVAPDGRSLALSQIVYSPTASRNPRRSGSSYRRFVQSIDAATGAERGTLRGHGDHVSALDFRPDGKFLACASGKRLWVYDVAAGCPVARIELSHKHFPAAAFSPDGRWLAAANNDRTVRFWDADTWREGPAFDWNLGPLTRLAFAPDGLRVAAANKRGQIVVWDLDV